MTGINSPYEAPGSPAYVAETGSHSIETIVSELAQLLLKDECTKP
jgi:adenylylsulfate kinase-like enzyme